MTTSFAVPVVRLALGLPLVPCAVVYVSSGELWSTPVKEVAQSLMPSVAPVTVTDIVCVPVVVATRYHSSADLVPAIVVVALVKLPPFQLAAVIEPVPNTSWKMSAVSTMTGFEPVTVCIHVVEVEVLNPV